MKLPMARRRFLSASSATPLRHLAEIQRINDRCGSNYLIEKTGSGWGVIAQRSWDVGDPVLTATILSTTQAPHSHTLQLGKDLHALISLPARLLNHNCNANLIIDPSLSSSTAIQFVARSQIVPNQELNFDYETSEENMEEPFDCNCNTSECRGIIRGYGHSMEDEVV